jgi:diguanylate cyclase (GGDEF)-like protein
MPDGVFMLLDLDNFKSINDQGGHIYGDCALTSFAGALQCVFGDIGILGRLGGDEFIIFLKGTGSAETAKAKSQELSRIASNTLSDRNTVLSFSTGIARVLADDTFSELYRKADTALYRAKQMGKNACVVSEEFERLPECIH